MQRIDAASAGLSRAEHPAVCRERRATIMATIRIMYQLSEVGRKASLLGGGNGNMRQEIDVEATPELLAIASVDTQGVATITPQRQEGVWRQLVTLDAPPSDPGGWVLQWHAEYLREMQAKKEHELAEQAKETLARTVQRAEQAARDERGRIEREASARLIAEFVATSGTEDQQERHLAGVLPQSEIDELAQSMLFKSFRGCPEYVRKQASDVIHDTHDGDGGYDCGYDECDRATIGWSSGRVSKPELNSTQWAALKAVRQVVADAGWPIDVDVVNHTAALSCRCLDPEWLSARVTITWAGHVYKRHYAI
jgi:hypothetical protein